MDYSSRLHPYMRVTYDQPLITLININKHIQMVCEYIEPNNYEYKSKIADFGGGNSCKALLGLVSIRDLTNKAIYYDQKSRTWRVERKKFATVWQKIISEQKYPELYPQYLQCVGRYSMFTFTKKVYQTNDAYLLKMQLLLKNYFQNVCQQALAPYEKGKATCTTLVACYFRLQFLKIQDFVQECDNKLSESACANIVSKYIREQYIKGHVYKSKIKTHNCGSWTFEHITNMGAYVKKPIGSCFAWGPKAYIKANK